MVDERASAPFWVREDRDGITVVRFTVTLILGIEMVHSLRDDLSALVEREGRRRLVLDFSGVELCDSLFIATLITLVRKLRDQRGRMAVHNLGPSTGEIFAALPKFYADALQFTFDFGDALAWCAADPPKPALGSGIESPG